MQFVSKKKEKKGGGGGSRGRRVGESKITFTFTKCFRLFTQHLSSSLCHSSGTKELARQTMLLRQKRERESRREQKRKEESRREEDRRQVRAQVVAKAPGGVGVMVLVI